MDTNEQVILLLAAGGSRRMGRPKQLLRYDDQAVIAHLVALLCKQERVVYVVLGAAHEQIVPLISRFPVQVVINENWAQGMGTSLRMGLRAVLQQEVAVQQVLCCVVDQVFLSQKILDHFWTLAKAHDLIAARYDNGVSGVPALFGKAYFADLLALRDEQGAKPLLKRYATAVKLVSFPRGAFDLDYPEDWAFFLERRQVKMSSEEE